MTVGAEQPPRGYYDLVTAARGDDRGLVRLERRDGFAAGMTMRSTVTSAEPAPARRGSRVLDRPAVAWHAGPQ